MIDVHFVIVGAVLTLGGEVFYIRDVLRGTVTPNKVTWLLWGLAPLLAFAVEIQGGVGLGALMTFSVGFGPLLVFFVSFLSPHALTRLTRLDIACGVLSLAGLAVWGLTRVGLFALVASVLADGLAALPTVVKSWRDPRTESATAFVGGLLNAAIALLTLRRLTMDNALFPGYIFAVNCILVYLIAVRPRILRRRLAP